MFIYEKKLQFPVNIRNTNPKLASIILSQYGGPDPVRQGSGELPFQPFCKPSAYCALSQVRN